MATTPPIFIARDPATIVAEVLAEFEARTGRTIQPAQVEMSLVNAIAYRETLLAARVQAAAEQNLVDFASGINLDFLGVLVGVTRLAASAASTVLLFTLVPGHGGVVIPAGTRVTSTDGAVTFATVASVAAAIGVGAIQVQAEATALGEAANGYGVGTITNLLDPLPFVSSITPPSNLSITAGGAETESDEQLRQRIKLAPAAFSNAGSYGAYRYWARTANANIVDVTVDSDQPGNVRIFPLMRDGQPTPSQVLLAVEAICSAETVRPLCDNVQVFSPSRVDYTLSVELTLYNTADAATVVSQVTDALQAFVDERRTTLGKDLIDTQIIAVCQVPGVYRVVLAGFSNITISATEFPYCTNFGVNVVGTTAG